MFPHLPSAGLERLLHLKTFNNPNLREFPPPEEFPRIQTLVLAYAYHCCAFLPLIPSNPPPKAKDFIVFPDIDDEIDMNMWNSSNLSDYWPSQRESLPWRFHSISIVICREYESQIWEEIRNDLGNYPIWFHISRELSLLHGGIRRRRGSQSGRKRRIFGENTMFAVTRSISTMSRFIWLVDLEVWRLDSISVCHAGQRDSRLRLDFLQGENGCSAVSSVQSRRGWLLHGDLFR